MKFRILWVVVLAVIVVGNSTSSAATTSRIYVPLVFRPSPPSVIRNGDFELGRNGDWQEQAPDGRALISSTSGVKPPSGRWLAVLGGRPNDTSMLTQQITVPTVPENTYIDLKYTYWPRALGGCTLDEASVGVEGADGGQHHVFPMCEIGLPLVWTRDAIDITPFAGQVVTVTLAMTTGATGDKEWLYLDDVSLGTYCTDPGCPPPQP